MSKKIKFEKQFPKINVDNIKESLCEKCFRKFQDPLKFRIATTQDISCEVVSDE